MADQDRWLRIPKVIPRATSEHVSYRTGSHNNPSLAISVALSRRHFLGFKAAVLFTDAETRQVLIMPVSADTEDAVVISGLKNIVNKNAVIASRMTVDKLFKEIGGTPAPGSYKAEWDFALSGVVVSFDVRVDPRAASRADCDEPYVVV
jgi:hypothetical protein